MTVSIRIPVTDPVIGENQGGFIMLPTFDHLTADNRELLDLVHQRERWWRHEPWVVNPRLFRACTVRVLLVTDGGLDFGSGDFGLRTFVKTLQQGASYYVRYEITLAHRNSRSGDQMMDPDPGISRRITNFDFANSDHFGTDMYDEAWLFGIDSSFTGIGDDEVRAIAEFMDADGGVFATGDHGSLGRAMGRRIPRVRNMRLWDNASGDVGMTDATRNDTNRRGHDTASTFDDQSDDVPQTIEPRLYTRRSGIWDVSYPHPLLCGETGVIDVMPDHPHEGECVEPTSVNETVTIGGASFVEYPPAAIPGAPRPLPEVISTNTVLTGSIAVIPGILDKDPTQPHTFGGICAYDGHRAGVGRVVTDATWHHFVNINLVGEVGATAPKNVGFLATSTGQAHLNKIKNYFRNIAIWIARPELIRCMNRRILWATIFNNRLVESLTTHLDVRLSDADLRLVLAVGTHARDVLGRLRGACQSRRLALDLLEELIDWELVARLDPWSPEPPEPDPSPWVSPEALIDLALGGAVFALRDEFESDDLDVDKIDEEAIDAVAKRGAATVIEAAIAELDSDLGRFADSFRGGTSSKQKAD